jgi:O-antigen ligase
MLLRFLRRLEGVFAVFAMLVLSSAVTPLFRRGKDLIAVNEEGNKVALLLLVVIYLVSTSLLLARFREAIRVTARAAWPLLLPPFAMASCLWSVAPGLTFRRGGALVASTLIGVYLATRFDLATIVRVLGWSILIAAGLSVAVAAGSPSLGTYSGLHSPWRGVFYDKNALGRVMALGVVTFGVLWGDARMRHWFAMAGVALACALVALSASKTAYVVTALFLVLLPLYRTLRMSASLATIAVIASVLVAAVVGVWLTAEADTVLASMGRSATLSGRTELWEAALEHLGYRPWLGYGFSAFWTSANDASRAIIDRIRWVPPHAHNGFLDLALALGLVGLTIFLAGFLPALVRAVRGVRALDGVEGLWPIAYFTFLVMYNLTDSALLLQGSIFWVLYVATVCATPRRAPAVTEQGGKPVRAGGRRRYSMGVARAAQAHAPRAGAAPRGRPSLGRRRGLPRLGPLPADRRASVKPAVPPPGPDTSPTGLPARDRE